MSLDDLREWLQGQGFKIEHDALRSRENRCDWYAWRRSSLPARECECNDGKIVLRPHSLSLSDRLIESVDVELCGQYGSWWNLKAYSMMPADIPRNLASIERSLVRAWNALATPTEGE